MSIIDQEERISKLKRMDNPTSKELRVRAAEGAKDFKASWVSFAQTLNSIRQDKLYEYWGYEKYEHYSERELGIKKAMALKLVKTYQFVEQQEPAYLKESFTEEREPAVLPELDAINVLRLAKNRKELTKQDFQDLRKQVFDKGCNAGLVRKDLMSMLKERKQVDPDEEREQRNIASLRRFLNAIRSFKKDAEALKMVKADVLKKADELFRDLESQLD
ncbi:MAG: hypothetical protein HQL22_04630 [Candidatus Omnitrophica bacterium]|nr:hypothetical protein [Candidatus Omnitrophota bacterium]